MKPFSICYDNILDLSTAVVTASSSAAEHAATLVQSYRRGLSWQSVGVGSAWMRVAFGAVYRATKAILFDDNLTTSAVVSIKGSVDGVTWTDVLMTAEHPSVGYVVIPLGDEFTTYAHLEFGIVDPTNPDGFFEIGRVFIGTEIEAEQPYTYNYGWSEEFICMDQTSVDENGVATTIVHPGYDRYELTFERLPPAIQNRMKVCRRVCGNNRPMWISLVPDHEDDETLFYVQFDSPSTRYEHPDFQQRSWQFQFRTVS